MISVRTERFEHSVWSASRRLNGKLLLKLHHIHNQTKFKSFFRSLSLSLSHPFRSRVQCWFNICYLAYCNSLFESVKMDLSHEYVVYFRNMMAKENKRERERKSESMKKGRNEIKIGKSEFDQIINDEHKGNIPHIIEYDLNAKMLLCSQPHTHTHVYARQPHNKHVFCHFGQMCTTKNCAKLFRIFISV